MTSPADAHLAHRSPGGPRIVVGVDGSSSSVRALAWAAAEAEIRGCTLEVVHARWARREALAAVGPGVLSGEQSILDRAVIRARALAQNITVRGRMCEPPAGEALIDASDGAEMLVVGSRGLTGLKGLTMGSVSSECAHHARCPVVIIRPPTAQKRYPPGSGRAGVPDTRRQRATTG